MKNMDHFSLSDIENLLGSNVSGAVNTLQTTQQTLDTLNPTLQYINSHIWEIIIGWFALTVLAAFIADKISK